MQTGREVFKYQFKSKLIPLVRAFKPDIILVSSGFDFGKADIGNGRHRPKYEGGADLFPEDFEWTGAELQVRNNFKIENCQYLL